MSSCGATCGITRERDRQKDAARALARTLVRSTEPDDEPAFTVAEAHLLARALEGALPCRACVVDGESARWIYLAATLANASWIELREGLCGDAPSGSHEVCLRVGLSMKARYATLQECRLEGAREPDGWWVEETRVTGVEDRRLQLFVKAAQGLLRSKKIVTLDAAFLLEPVDEPDGANEATSPPETTLWSVFFDDTPTASTVGVFLPRSAAVG